MDERDWLAEQFEDHRGRLRAVAYRMLGLLSEADDALQEAWLRLSRTNAGEVEIYIGNLGVKHRLCKEAAATKARKPKI